MMAAQEVGLGGRAGHSSKKGEKVIFSMPKDEVNEESNNSQIEGWKVKNNKNSRK